MPEKMTLHIIIDGDSADELFAVGPNDLKDYFLPEKLNVNTADIKQISFSKVKERSEYGVPTLRTEHKDNYVREVNKIS